VLSLPFALRYLLATRPDTITQVLGIVYRAISGHLIRQTGLTRASAATGAVTLIQRFGSALNINVHFHLLVLDGVYRRAGEGRLVFVPVPAPSAGELRQLVQQIATRVGRSLERAGLITREIENAYLAFDPAEESPMHGLLGSSITYRIATGPREGQKVFTLQTLPPEPDAPRREVAESSGFSLHAGLAATASQRAKLERLARYVSRPPVATGRLALTGSGQDVGETAGYGVLDLSARYRLLRSLVLVAGVDNVLDRTYANHLNRGNLFDPDPTRINEPGRTFWIRLSWLGGVH